MSKYSEKFKLEVVREYLQGAIGYTLLAKKYGIPSKSPIIGWVRAYAFKMNNPSLIASWSSTLRKEGIEGLQEKAKGRPSMSKNQKKESSKSEKELTREEQLERENELLRLENSYLKKVKAFQENPNAYLEKHKQRWYSNSKKKDSN